MKSKTLAWSALVLLAAPSGERLLPRYRTDVEYRHEELRRYRMEPRGHTMTLNGRELPPEEAERIRFEFPGHRMTRLQRTTTRYTEANDGVPLVARRTFDALEQRRTAGEGPEEELEGALAGETITLRAGGDGEVVAELEGGGEVDASLLERHRLELPNARYLPDEAVDLGDSWELGEEALGAILALGQRQGPKLFENEGGGFGDVVDRHAELEGEVTFEAIEERDGLRCAVLVVELALEVDDAEVGQPGPGGPATRMSVELEGSERIWLALDAGHPVAAVGDVEGTTTMETELSGGDSELVVNVEADLSFGWTSSWSVE
ncbi:MAG: hypothetical protein AAF682_30990 [Planctomycetota bacterium]